MELCSIASGSSGNCVMVGSDHTRLLIDAGLSGKRIEQGLNLLGHKTSEMKGILVTHEHADHISGLGVLARRYGLPVYATRRFYIQSRWGKSIRPCFILSYRMSRFG